MPSFHPEPSTPATYEILTKGFILPAHHRTADEPDGGAKKGHLDAHSEMLKGDALLEKYLLSQDSMAVHILFMFT